MICELCQKKKKSHWSYPTICSACASDLMVQDGIAKRGGAHGKIQRAVTNGSIAPPDAFGCVDCPARAVAYDHRDYNKPLDVVPVCVLIAGKANAAGKSTSAYARDAILGPCVSGAAGR